jgi:hypothetical protein
MQTIVLAKGVFTIAVSYGCAAHYLVDPVACTPASGWEEVNIAFSGLEPQIAGDGQLVAGAIGIMTSKLAALHAGFWLKDGTTARHQSEVAKALDDACAAFPSRSIRFSLFTVRHQFIANMKAVLQDDAVVSALIGRLIVKTERVHYTKVRAAWSAEDISEVPSPLVRDVGRFRRLLAMYQEALTIREAKSERRRIDEDVGKR